MSVEITVGAVTPVHLYGEKEQTNKQTKIFTETLYIYMNKWKISGSRICLYHFQFRSCVILLGSGFPCRGRTPSP